MKITFFLTLKSDVAWVSTAATVRQALERMEHYGYTAVPVLSQDGKYEGTLTDGDLLWYLKNNPEVSIRDTERIPLAAVPRKTVVRVIDINAEIEELFTLALDQNFVPVVDDREVFIGIVTRKSILSLLLKSGPDKDKL